MARAREDDRYQNGLELSEVAPLAGGAFSAQLVPQIAALLAKYRFTKTDIEAFIVVSGPGSFTGLRVGLAAIKALAEVLKKPIVPVSLLEVLALASHQQGTVAAVLDAGRGDVYFGLYEIAGDSVQVVREQLLSRSEFLSAARDSIVVTPAASLLAAVRRVAVLRAVVVFFAAVRRAVRFAAGLTVRRRVVVFFAAVRRVGDFAAAFAVVRRLVPAARFGAVAFLAAVRRVVPLAAPRVVVFAFAFAAPVLRVALRTPVPRAAFV